MDYLTFQFFAVFSHGILQSSQFAPLKANHCCNCPACQVKTTVLQSIFNLWITAIKPSVDRSWRQALLLCTVFENYRKSLIQHCEQRYVYIFSGQKLIKNAKIVNFWRVFENLKLAVKQCYQKGHF